MCVCVCVLCVCVCVRLSFTNSLFSSLSLLACKTYCCRVEWTSLLLNYHRLYACVCVFVCVSVCVSVCVCVSKHKNMFALVFVSPPSISEVDLDDLSFTLATLVWRTREHDWPVFQSPQTG